MILPIVEPKELEKCPEWSIPVKGSVGVLIEREYGTLLYYEGGAYTRFGGREPTAEERVEYAKQAAGRASQDYPTTAKVGVLNPDAYKKIGQVDCTTWEVTFDA